MKISMSVENGTSDCITGVLHEAKRVVARIPAVTGMIDETGKEIVIKGRREDGNGREAGQIDMTHTRIPRRAHAAEERRVKRRTHVVVIAGREKDLLPL